MKRNLAIYPVGKIHKLIGREHVFFPIHGLGKIVVYMSSTRLLMFKRRLRCPICRRIANRFILSHDPHSPYPNKGCLTPFSGSVMFTIDHIIPLSKGGNNNPKNKRVVCGECNGLKSNRKIDDEVLRVLRRAYQIIRETYPGGAEQRRIKREIRRELGVR